jgi:DNA-binding transcriptional ArsR family regulator
MNHNPSADRREAMSTVAAALSDPTRISIIEHLAQGPLTAGQIVDLHNLKQPTISPHLAVLRSARVVTVTRERQNNIYRLRHADSAISACAALRDVAR